ncbi:MAG: methyltransferase domain-containing protein [Flavobacteriaceae bacterium]|nr:methyltransferase domain-containing protein [Muriicola sp.]MBT8289400.1 methyltransferase domain-containing protein [Muriicola sp.]NNK20875.1 methyltransferase domain-containing protein [Flavobacteriaceae bacterium]NNK34592.1 methyltransferase domain-containing protein [Eudoraea sp.]NNL40618.1 methyltransferase domain-containing protein [Flavobacteriaceae bacterium]
MKGTKEFWDQRYLNRNMGWDIGEVSTPLKEYIDQLTSKDLRILVPGAGNGYEVSYLFNHGFKSVYALDISEIPFKKFKKEHPDFPKDQLLIGDFFEFDEMKFDLILEQTFFCALQPDLRENYAKKMHALLKDGGVLAGLFFDFELTEDGPPYGGDIEEYREVFSKYFHIRKLERAYNSIPPRQGSELFFIFEKKTTLSHGE